MKSTRATAAAAAGGLLALAGCAAAPLAGIDRCVLRTTSGEGPTVLCVTAHPDDEIAFAATLYKTSILLGGACDILVITNGEGGYKYSTLAEPLYGLELTDPAVGRAALPRIRRTELLAGCELLGVRQVFFLHQTDHRYTLDIREVLAPRAKVWDLDYVRASIAAVLQAGAYDFVLTHLPHPRTHAHHKAATILTLRAVAAMPPDRRPVVLAAGRFRRDDAAQENEASARREPFRRLEGFPLTAIRTDREPLVFNRAQKLGFRNRLDYRIVVRWVIAEHKSQGTMQLSTAQREEERYQLYVLNPPDADLRAERWFDALAAAQFDRVDYDEHGNLREKLR